jgi:hypothetical protein
LDGVICVPGETGEKIFGEESTRLLPLASDSSPATAATTGIAATPPAAADQTSTTTRGPAAAASPASKERRAPKQMKVTTTSTAAAISASHPTPIDLRKVLSALLMQLSLNPKHDKTLIGFQNALNMLARTCGDYRVCAHYVIVTNEDRAPAFHWGNLTGGDDDRFPLVRQWLLIVPSEITAKFTSDE